MSLLLLLPGTVGVFVALIGQGSAVASQTLLTALDIRTIGLLESNFAGSLVSSHQNNLISTPETTSAGIMLYIVQASLQSATQSTIQGATAPSLSISATGAQLTGFMGVVSPTTAATVQLLGLQQALSSGMVYIDFSKGLAGIATTALAGTVAVQSTKGITGVAQLIAAGASLPSLDKVLLGQVSREQLTAVLATYSVNLSTALEHVEQGTALANAFAYVLSKVRTFMAA